jgi:hypothetical protein
MGGDREVPALSHSLSAASLGHKETRAVLADYPGFLWSSSWEGCYPLKREALAASVSW